MGYAVFNTTTQELVYFTNGPEPTPAAGQVLVKNIKSVDPRTQRYDGRGGLRATTTEEIATYDNAKAASNTDNWDKELRAIIRAAGLTKQQVKTEYEAL